jgi:hypothetical protein
MTVARNPGTVAGDRVMMFATTLSRTPIRSGFLLVVTTFAAQ